MAAKGYPGTPEKGGAIAGLDASRAPRSSTPAPRSKDGRLVADGGRVLGVTARGTTVAEAQARRLSRRSTRSTFPTGFCRRDIGWREIARLKGAA